MENRKTKPVCQFCEISSEIKYKCLNCDLDLCGVCDDRIHANIKSDVVHKRTTIEGDEKETEVKILSNMSVINCTIHKSKPCIIYCKECEKPICSSCIIENHQQHKLVELDEEFQRQKDYLGVLKTQIQDRLLNISTIEETIGRNQSEGRANHSAVKSEILKHENNLTSTINDYTDSINKNISDRWSMREDYLKRHINDARHHKEELVGIQKMINDLTLSDQVTYISEQCSLIKSKLPSKELYLVQSRPIVFVKPIICDFLEDRIGSIDIQIGIVHDTVSFDVICTYETELERIEYIESLSPTKLLLYDAWSGMLQVFTHSSADLQRVSQKRIGVSDIAVTNDGRIYILSNNKIKCFRECLTYKSEQLSVIDSQLEVEIFCIDVNQHNEIIIGVTPYAKFQRIDADHNSSDLRSSDCDYDECDEYDNYGYYDDSGDYDYYDDDDHNDYYDDDDSHDYYDDDDHNGYYADDDHNGDSGDYYNDDQQENSWDPDTHNSSNENDSKSELSNITDEFVNHENHDSQQGSDDEVNNEHSDNKNNSSEDNYIFDNESKDSRDARQTVAEILIDHSDDFERLKTGFIPLRIVATSNDDFCAIEENKENKRRVVCFNKTVGILWTYSGCLHHSIIQFHPIQLTISKFDFVFVLDSGRAIHILNPKGDLLTCDFLRDKVGGTVSSISVDTSGQMWVGSHKRSGETGSMIYCLRFN